MKKELVNLYACCKEDLGSITFRISIVAAILISLAFTAVGLLGMFNGWQPAAVYSVLFTMGACFLFVEFMTGLLCMIGGCLSIEC